MERRLEELTEARARVEQGLSKALAAGNETTAGIIKGLLAEHDVEITAIKTLLATVEARTDEVAKPPVAEASKVVLVESSPKASAFEISVNTRLLGKIYNRLTVGSKNFDLNEKETEGIKELEKKGRAVFEELTSAEPLWTEFKTKLGELKTKLDRDIEMSDIISDPEIQIIRKDLEEGQPFLAVPPQVRRLFILEDILVSIGKGLEFYKTGVADKQKAGDLGEDLQDLYDLIEDMAPIAASKESVKPVEAVSVASLTTEISPEAKPAEATEPPVAETPIDLNFSTRDLFSRLENLRAKEADEPDNEPGPEVTAIQNELNKRYQNIVQAKTEAMKNFTSDRLEEKISRLTREEERLVESNKNPKRLMEVQAEIQAANDLLRLKEVEEEAASSTTEVSDTLPSETAPVETAPPAEAPTETEVPLENPVVASPIGPAKINEETGEKRLEDMDVSELQQKARELSGKISKLETNAEKAKKQKKKDSLLAQIKKLKEELAQANQEFASR